MNITEMEEMGWLDIAEEERRQWDMRCEEIARLDLERFLSWQQTEKKKREAAKLKKRVRGTPVCSSRS